jgi:hypothetical protein
MIANRLLDWCVVVVRETVSPSSSNSKKISAFEQKSGATEVEDATLSHWAQA